jgi:hypothetical protein
VLAAKRYVREAGTVAFERLKAAVDRLLELEQPDRTKAVAASDDTRQETNRQREAIEALDVIDAAEQAVATLLAQHRWSKATRQELERILSILRRREVDPLGEEEV